MEKWYYSTDGNQQGPVPRETLEDLLRRRTIPASSLVWRDGMQNWQAADSLPSLQAVLTSSDIGPATANPYAAPTDWSAPVVQPSRMASFPPVKRTNYTLAMLLNAAGLTGLIFGIFTGGIGGPDRGTLVAASGLVALIWGTVLFWIYLYRAWHVLQPFYPRTTPGRAVGFLFIPFFNLYWSFVAYWRWSQDWNRNVGLVISGAPHMKEGLFLAYAIIQCVSVVAGALAILPAFIVYLILMKGVCDAVNFAAAHSTENTAASLSNDSYLK